jgi:ribose transport system permease protein
VRSATQTTSSKEPKNVVAVGARHLVSRGLATVIVATVGLFVASYLFASTSVTRGTLLTMLPFAAALAVAGLGQTLVVMQGGIDLSVA